jgi:hypothetical protein
MLPIDPDKYVCYVDYNLGRMLLWRAGFRLRRLDADRLGVWPQEGNDRKTWKPGYVTAEEAVEKEPAHVLHVDEGSLYDVLHPDGRVTNSLGGQEVLDGSHLIFHIVRRFHPNFSPDTPDVMGRRRLDRAAWESTARKLLDDTGLCSALGVLRAAKPSPQGETTPC